MAVKDTLVAPQPGRPPRWVETDGESSVELSVTDQQDSVTLQLQGKVLKSWAPGLEARMEIRMTYGDLLDLVQYGKEILDRHPGEYDPF